MIYVITDRGVVAAEKLAQVNHELDAKIDKDELTFLGADAVVKLTDRDIDFVQDKKKMSSILFGNFFKKDNSVKIICIMTAVFSFINVYFSWQFYQMLKSFLSAATIN